MANNVRIIALKDITKWMREKNIQIMDKHGDVWVVSASRIDTPEQRRLNKKLGVSKINYTSRKMRKNVAKRYCG